MITRAYAARRLARLPERATELARRHVLYFDQLLARNSPNAELAARYSWVNDSACSIEDIRSSIERTLEISELRLAIRMIVNSAPIWLYLDRVEDFRTLAANALVEIRPEATIEEHSAAQVLQQTVANSHWHSFGNAADKELAFSRSLELASSLGLQAHPDARVGRCQQ
jgi:hypothetical protein